VRFQVITAASMKFRVFWDVAPCSHAEVYGRFRGAYCIIRVMMELVRTSETSVNFNVTTRRCIPEDTKLREIGGLKMNWKECGRNRLWPNLRYHPGV
jgi:hypothetical protein